MRETIKELLEILGCKTPGEGAQKFSRLMQSIGCPTRLKELGHFDADILQQIAENVNLERLKNNPRILRTDGMNQILEAIR